MVKLLDFIFMIQGFNVLYNGDVFTTTKWAQFVCNLLVREGTLFKENKNHYKYVIRK